MRAIRILLCCVFAFALTHVLQGQESRWDNLSHTRPGTTVDVVEYSLQKTSGRFVRFSAGDLTLKVAKNDVSIPRTQVYRVTVVGKDRKRNTILGLAIGAGAGVALGATLMEHESGYGGAVAGTTVGFAGLGAGVGAVFPARKTIYRGERMGRIEKQDPGQK